MSRLPSACRSSSVTNWARLSGSGTGTGSISGSVCGSSSVDMSLVLGLSLEMLLLLLMIINICMQMERSSHYLHSVVLLIANVNEAECIGCYAPRIIEFAICGALRTEGAQEASLWIKHLYAMIVSAT